MNEIRIREDYPMDYRVIKENDVFMLTDIAGDISPTNHGHGLYTKDTRFVSRLALLINGERPVSLASDAGDNYAARILLTNQHMERDGELILWRESIELARERFIYGDVCYETVRATNYNPHRQAFELAMLLDADFKDMFDVRGYLDGTVGRRLAPVVDGEEAVFGYEGADAVRRELRVRWSMPPVAIETTPEGLRLSWRFELEAGATATVPLALLPVIGGAVPQLRDREEALGELRASYAQWTASSTAVASDLPLYDALYARGLQDIRVLLTDLGEGRFPVAGLPWFAVPFGRDSLIAALQLLPVHPEIAKGTLLTMARYQGTRIDPWRDEQPGKIMHELRSGEYAATDQIPFTPYYGTVDATPLFLVLACEYVKWTDDRELFLTLLPAIRRALAWIDEYGDAGGRGLLSYHQESSKGLANQGWKDSGNAIAHRSGSYAETPIALVEVQGYVYQAKRQLAELLRALPLPAEEEGAAWAERLEAEADALRERCEAAYWLETDDYYALAIDGRGEQVETVTSNPGHLLMSGLPSPERAAAVARKLVSPALFSGYGIRTMAEGEQAYNPMSYHNGSIWPHDNSLCLLGLAAQGFREEATVVMEGLLEAARHFDEQRLPELYCGYGSERGRPVSYPVACSPQAWAAATPFTFLPAMLGLRLDYARRIVRLAPTLPAGMDRLTVTGLRLGEGELELRVAREHDGCRIEVIANTTGWTVQTDRAASGLAAD